MKTKKFSLWANLALLVLLLFVGIAPVAAEDGDDGGGDSLWGEVLNSDGSVRYDNLIDQGVQTENVDWMPSVEVFGQTIGGTAEYHVYETPSGNIVQLPTATTLFFMSLNKDASGYNDASANTLVMPGLISSVLGDAGVTEFGDAYVSADQYADALIAGETNIFSLGIGDIWNIMTSLGNVGIDDMNIYTSLFLYTPDNIPEELLEMLPEEPEIEEAVIPDPPACPAGYATPGKISTSGTMVSPNYPLVVGQDPDKRGVDLQFNASVAPTVYTYWDLVPIRELGTCGSIARNNLRSCMVIVDWVCEIRSRSYPETIPVAYGSANLTSTSRDWILNTLSIRYPGAYIHNGSFKYPSSSGGSSWHFDKQGVQVQDPGTWSLTVRGRTSGTPVSAARNFGGEAGSFDVYLKETAIIQ